MMTLRKPIVISKGIVVYQQVLKHFLFLLQSTRPIWSRKNNICYQIINCVMIMNLEEMNFL